MRGLLGAIRRRWHGHHQPSPPAPFAVKCRCGHVVIGERTPQAQVLPCPGCGESLFVFSRSPLPPVGGLPSGAGKAGPRASGLRFWILPAAAAIVTLAAVIVLLIVLVQKNDESPDGPRNGGNNVSPQTIEQRTSAARQLLKEGSFRLAREVLRSIVAEDDRNLDVRQLYREADLLADLLKLPLEEVVQQAQLVQPDEWEAQFQDFKGRAVIFDDMVLCELGPNGRYALVNYQLRVGDERVRVELDQKLFRQLERAGRLQPGRPQRLIFGARLASVQRGAGGWTIAFADETTVLMTEENALTACGLDGRDPDLQRVLRDQREWLRKK